MTRFGEGSDKFSHRCLTIFGDDNSHHGSRVSVPTRCVNMELQNDTIMATPYYAK